MGHMQSQKLERQQQQLLIRSAELRVALAHHAKALQAPLAVGDRIRAGTQWLLKHPLLPLAALALLALKRPRRMLSWGSRLMWGWGLYQQVRNRLDSKAAKPR